MFMGKDPDRGKFLLRALTLIACTCLLSISVIGVIANLAPLYAASSPPIPLVLPQDTLTPSVTGTASPTATDTASPTATGTSTPTPTATSAPTMPPTSTPTAPPKKTSTPTPVATSQGGGGSSQGVSPTVSATAQATATSAPTATATSSLPSSSGPGSSHGGSGQNRQTNPAGSQGSSKLLLLITGALLTLLSLLLLAVLLIRQYIAPRPLKSPRLAPSGARPWRRTRSPESLAGDQDWQGNTLSPGAGSGGGWQPPTEMQLQAQASQPSPGPSSTLLQSRPFILSSNGQQGNGTYLPQSFASAPTQAQMATRAIPPSGNPSASPSAGFEEDTTRRLPRLRPTPRAANSPGSYFLFPTSSLMPTTGELPVASEMAFTPNGISPFKGNFLFPTTSLVPPTPESFGAANGAAGASVPPTTPAPSPKQSGIAPQPGLQEPAANFQTQQSYQAQSDDLGLPAWLSGLTASLPGGPEDDTLRRRRLPEINDPGSRSEPPQA
jgi:hypothetical protein